MDVHFSKYHGAGNDFIFIDNRESKYKLNDNQRKKLCTRHFGIGADGLLEIKSSDKADFKLLYFNSDGKEGTLCGNGSRCAIAFAFKIGVKHTKVISTDVGVTERDHILQTATESDQQINNMNNKSCIEESKHRTSHILDRGDSELDRGRSEHDSCKDLTFEAFDGIHVGGLSCGTIASSCYNSSMFYTDIKDVDCENVKIYSNGDIFVNTGSPHHVICLSASVGDLDVVKQGRKVMQELYKKDGCNINFVARCRNTLNSSNFEREIEKCRDCEIMFGNVDSDNAKIFSEKCLQKGPSQLRPEDKGDADIVTRETSNICLHVRTYERGVENETMACGTGCVAVAIADYVKQSQEKYSKNDDEKLEFFNVEDNTSSDVFNISKYGNKNDNTKLAKNNIPGGIYKLESEKRTIFMPGGCLLVTFTVTNQEKPLCGNIIRFCDMKLSGPVQHVFDGVCVL